MVRRLAAVTLCLLVLTACGTSSNPPRQAGDLNATETGNLGTIVADAGGRTLYRFDQDTARPPVSHCYDQCAALWPPILTGTGTVTIQGLDQQLIGTTTRRDGTQQVTLNGWPLYRYLKDTAAGEVAGQGVDGVWFAVTPDGGKAVATAPSSSDSGGGY
jgi:predicted lipoprotein with Yx(FWY)xxD motif